jgi:hypothetical protein
MTISLDTLERRLRALPDRVISRVLARAIRQALNPVRRDIRNALPRDTGQLRRSMRIATRRLRGRGQSGVVGKIGFTRRGAHANLVELGTHNADGSVRTPATHAVRDTFAQQEDKLFEAFAKELLSQIGRELKRL